MVKRRRPRVVWLPVARANRINVTGDAISGDQNAGFRFALEVPTLDLPLGVTGLIPIVADNPTNVALTGGINTLSDVENSGYRLRRIVGKVYVSAAQFSSTQSWSHALITLGFIILRVRPDGTPLNLIFDAYAPQAIDAVADPWIWRRTYALGNNAATIAKGVLGQNFAFWPESNTTAGSALDGPHIDQKTARLVTQEERLFLVAQGVALDTVAQQTQTTTVDIVGEVRVLASMRTTSGNRRNASR